MQLHFINVIYCCEVGNSKWLHSGLLLNELFDGLYKGLLWYTTQSKLVKTQTYKIEFGLCCVVVFYIVYSDPLFSVMIVYIFSSYVP